MNSQLDTNGYASNSMDAIVVAKAVDVNDLQFNVNIMQLNDLNSNIQVENTKVSDVRTNIIIQRNEYSDLQFNIDVRQLSDLYSNISVAAKNVIFGLVDAQHPPIISKQVIPYKDAYISSKYPTFNSGLTKGLTVGNLNGETYRSFMGFNLAFLKGCVIKKANLVLKLQSSMDTNIRLLSFTDSWMEENITWKNQPKTVGILASAAVKNDTSQVTIDIQDYIQNHINTEQYYYSFRLDDADKTNNRYIAIDSRENIEPSYLDIEYFSTEVVNYGKIQVKSNITVQQNKTSDINCNININRYNDVSKLPSKLTIRRPEMIDSNIIISRDFLRFNINIKKYYKESLNSKITIRKHSYEELDSNIIISKPFLNSNVRITNYSDIDSSIKIRVEEINEVVSNVIIRRHEVHDILSKINIKQLIDIPSSINITHDTVYGNLSIRRHEMNDFDSNIKVRLHDFANITGSINISHGTMLSNIAIRRHDESNINSNIIIRLHNKNDLNGSLVVSKREIQSNIIVRQHGISDLNNTINIRPTSNLNSNIIVTIVKDLNSKLNVRNTTFSEIRGKIGVTYFDNLESNIAVRQFANNDFNSIIAVRRHNESSINGNIIIHPASNLNGSIIVTVVKDLNSNINIRNTTFSEIHSKLTVKYRNDIQSNISVKQFTKNDFDSIITVRQHETNDFGSNIIIRPTLSLDSNIEVMHFKDLYCRLGSQNTTLSEIHSKIIVKHHNDIESNIIIKQFANNDIISTIYINTDSGYVFIM
jgi:hypothetical protein